MFSLSCQFQNGKNRSCRMIRSEVIYPDRSKQVFKLRFENDKNQNYENDKNDKNNANSSKVRKFSQDVFLEKGIKSN